MTDRKLPTVFWALIAMALVSLAAMIFKHEQYKSRCKTAQGILISTPDGWYCAKGLQDAK